MRPHLKGELVEPHRGPEGVAFVTSGPMTLFDRAHFVYSGPRLLFEKFCMIDDAAFL